MEQNQFEDELRRLSEDFQMPVKKGLFEHLMDKRAREQRLLQRRKQGLWVASLLLMLAGVFILNTVLVVNPLNPKNQEQVVTVSDKLKTSPSAAPEQLPTNNAEQLANLNEQTRVNRQQTEEVNVANKQSAAAKSGMPFTSVKSKVSNQRSITEQRDVTSARRAASEVAQQNVTPLSARPKSTQVVTNPVAQRNKKDNSQPETVDTAHQIAIQHVSSNKPKVLTELGRDTTDVSKHSFRKLETLTSDLVNDTLKSISWNPDTFSTQPSRFYPVSLFCNTTYFPVVLSRNTSSMVPMARTVGLSEDALFAFGMKTGLLLDLSTHVSIGAALGFYKINYDKVRVAPNMKDTANESIISLNTNFEYNLADVSMSWFEIPLFVQYNQKVGNKVALNIRTGLSYQYLMHTTSYLFTTKVNFFDYREVNNYDNKRIQQHQLALTFEPGITWSVSKHIGIYTAVTFQQQLWSYYQLAFASRTPATLLGVTSGVQYKF